jgi:glycosyltransferase involved in cell wall biosynthesis
MNPRADKEAHRMTPPMRAHSAKTSKVTSSATRSATGSGSLAGAPSRLESQPVPARPPGNVYIVVPTHELGGAEKRFVGLFLHYKQEGWSNVRLVLREELRQSLSRTGEFADALQRYQGHIIVAPAGTSMRAGLGRFLRGIHAADPRGVFHFVTLPPTLVQVFSSHRTLFTLATSSMKHFNRVGRADIYLGILRAARTDVLDPDVYRSLGRQFWFKRGALSLTPNSYVDLDYYAPAPTEERRQRITFVGTFSAEKQARRLVDQLPAIAAGLRARGIDGVEFRLLGKELSSPGLSEVCEALRPAIDVKAWFDRNPRDVLRASRVFLSLQRASNYPSKALLEGMACGVLPVATDVGSTRTLVREDFGWFVPRDFSAEDIARCCAEILLLAPEVFRAKVAAMRAHLAENFSVESMARYYRHLYHQLAAS